MDWISINADIIRITKGSVTFDNDKRIRREAIRRIQYADGSFAILCRPMLGKKVRRVLVSDFVVKRLDG